MSVVNFKNKKLSVGIVGAGPAGAMLAYLLAKKGHDVQILERKHEVERKVCGEYLCPKGVELLGDLNLLDKLCSGFEPLNGMVLVSPKDLVIPTYFPQSIKNEKGLSLNRQIFDSKLLKLALDNGAILLADKTVIHAFQKPDGKWSVLANEEYYEFDLLVAADGRQSNIGRILGHVKDINTNRVALHCYLPRKIARGVRLGEMHIFENGSYCGLDPINDDEVNFSIVCDSKRLKKEKPRSIINDTIKNSKRLSEMFNLVGDEGKTEIRIVSCLKNNNHFIAGNNLAYVGDSSGFIDPLTGEGIYNAVLASKLLASSLEENNNLKSALEAYKKEKKKLSFQKNTLNLFFQFLIRRPFLVNLTANFLKRSPARANQFIGIIGNIHGPIKGLVKMLTV